MIERHECGFPREGHVACRQSVVDPEYWPLANPRPTGQHCLQHDPNLPSEVFVWPDECLCGHSGGSHRRDGKSGLCPCAYCECWTLRRAEHG